jgi:hypothetical protein
MRLAEHVVRIGKKQNACRLLVGKPEGKRPLARPRYRLMNNIKGDLKWDGVVWKWIDLA